MRAHDGDFSLWGRREYVHGTHMTLGLLRAAEGWGLGPVLRLTAGFRDQLRSQGRYELLEQGESQPASVADFHFETGQGAFHAALTATGEPVTGQLPDDETDLTGGAVVDPEARRAVLERGFDPALMVRSAVALNKRLLLAALPVEGYAPWFMAQLELGPEILDGRAARLELAVESVMAGLMARTKVLADGAPSGRITFHRRKA